MEIKNEPMLFSADFGFAADHAGPITRPFLNFLITTGEPLTAWIIDSRVHMLMAGWFPAIPGFHHDDIPRTRPGDNQPDYDNPAYKAYHVMGMVDDGTGSHTEYLTSPITVSKIPIGKTIYEAWDREVTAQLVAGKVQSARISSGSVLKFGPEDFHRAIAATGTGWRYFIRATRGSGRKPSNELRQQTQVYMSCLTAGW